MDRNFHDFHRGEVYYADLNPVIGHEQGGVRPVLVIQNDTGNYHSPNTPPKNLGAGTTWERNGKAARKLHTKKEG